jgi:hypothetical protein
MVEPTLNTKPHVLMNLSDDVLTSINNHLIQRKMQMAERGGDSEE